MRKRKKKKRILEKKLRASRNVIWTFMKGRQRYLYKRWIVDLYRRMEKQEMLTESLKNRVKFLDDERVKHFLKIEKLIDFVWENRTLSERDIEKLVAILMDDDVQKEKVDKIAKILWAGKAIPVGDVFGKHDTMGHLLYDDRV